MNGNLTKTYLLLLINLFFIQIGIKGNISCSSDDPLIVVKRIGDKLIRDTPYRYKLVVPGINKHFNNLQVIDFGRAFGTFRPACAYALTNMTVHADTSIVIEIAHNDGCMIWINGDLAYSKHGNRKLSLSFEERGVGMPDHFTAVLKKGDNRLLIKSECTGNEWIVAIQPPGLKGYVLKNKINYPYIGLDKMPYVDKKVADLTNWLIIGPFDDHGDSGFNKPFAPEYETVFGRMYKGATGNITWSIPKVEIFGDLIDPLPWGTNYTWNYHNGGVAWAMQCLSEVSNQDKYYKYAVDFCNFHLNGASFVEYQVKTLHGVNSSNSNFLFSPLLDFTLAPSLPFIYRLNKEKSFENRDLYIGHIARMIKYAKEEQVRLPGSGIFTRLSPEKYTTWVDDMFMGIPFLLQASTYLTQPDEKKAFLDDAANQVIKFYDQVWDKDASLYVHAKYSGRDVKLPHWSRGNGWGIWAVTEVLFALPKNHPCYKTILSIYRKHVQSLATLQDNNGFWRQVLDRPDSREEVSGTAIFTMALARGITNGWINDKKYIPVVLKGWEALKSQIENDGTVHNICYGTMCSEDVNYYLDRPFYDNDTHGIFAVIFAGIEVSNMLKFHK